jgi:hypothetical protein
MIIGTFGFGYINALTMLRGDTEYLPYKEEASIHDVVEDSDYHSVDKTHPT